MDLVRKRFAASRVASRVSVCLVVLMAFTSCRKEIDELGIRLTLDQRTLPNGLRVIMVENTKVPVISYQTWFRVGSVDEKPGITGISHLFEHLMFKGTDRHGPREFFNQLETKGAEVNAFTTRDYTVYHETFTPELLSKVIELEADRLGHLKLDRQTLETERQVVLEERRGSIDANPGGLVNEALWSLSYRRHPYQWPVIGYTHDVSTLTLDQIREYFSTHYVASNATVVIVGAFKADETFDLIKKAYGSLPARPRPKREIREEPEQNEERRLKLYDQVASERFAQAYHVTSADEDDSFALDVLANILFEGTSSRAWRKLVEEKDIVSSVDGSAFTPTYRGLFVISVAMRTGVDSGLAESELDRLIREVQENGATVDEIRAAVRQLTVQMVDSVRTPNGLARLLGTVVTVLGEPERFKEDLAKYTRVTSDDVKRVANRYLIPNNRSVVTLLPEGRRKK